MATEFENNKPLLVDNKVYMEIQPSTYIDPYLDVTMEVVFANELSRYDDGEHRTMPNDLAYQIDSNSGGTVGTNIITQLQKRMDNIDGGPWYVDVYNGEIIIHNHKFRGLPLEEYEYDGGNGELLSATFKTVKLNRTVSKIITHNVSHNRVYQIGGNYMGNFGGGSLSSTGDQVVQRYISRISTSGVSNQMFAASVSRDYARGKITFDQYDAIMQYVENTYTNRKTQKYSNGIYKLQLGTSHWTNDYPTVHESGKWGRESEAMANSKRQAEMSSQKTAAFNKLKAENDKAARLKAKHQTINPIDTAQKLERLVFRDTAADENIKRELQRLMNLRQTNPKEFEAEYKKFMKRFEGGGNSWITVDAKDEAAAPSWRQNHVMISTNVGPFQINNYLAKFQAIGLITPRQLKDYKAKHNITDGADFSNSYDPDELAHIIYGNLNDPQAMLSLNKYMDPAKGDKILAPDKTHLGWRIYYQEGIKVATKYKRDIIYRQYFNREYGDYTTGGVSGFDGYGGGGSIPPMMPAIISTPTPHISNSIVQKKEERNFKKASITCIGNPALHNTSSITLKNVGKKWSGSWYMHTVIHSLVPNQGYTCKAEMSVSREEYQAEVNFNSANTTLSFGTKNKHSNATPQVQYPSFNTVNGTVMGNDMGSFAGGYSPKQDIQYVHQLINTGRYEEAEKVTQDMMARQAKGDTSPGSYVYTKSGGTLTDRYQGLRYTIKTSAEDRAPFAAKAKDFVNTYSNSTP